MTHLLDSTALLALLLDEPEAELVESLILGTPGACAVSFATWVEVQGRLKALEVPQDELAAQLADARALPITTLWADERVLDGMLAIKQSGYFPFADALIAATAWANSLTLVHKDSHFGALPKELPQLDLQAAPGAT
jgi:predicted nucleic acid-binding protein